ncbi:MAG: FAD-dependent oxidoreductase, partial [Planctomycetes bacterium]|nr:FAD-dependent oxidoreductase [Planctomycetota bacterium]
AILVACGAQNPRTLTIPGIEEMMTAYDFLRNINLCNKPDFKGHRVVIIGVGNVGMDVAAQAYFCGANEVVAVDIQEPAAFGKELEIAQSLGTKILWPKFTDKYAKEEKRVYFTDGTSLEADTVIFSIGDTPDTDFLPPDVQVGRDGWIEADEAGHTSDPRVFAIGDVTMLGLATHAIGHARRAADAI